MWALKVKVPRSRSLPPAISSSGPTDIVALRKRRIQNLRPRQLLADKQTNRNLSSRNFPDSHPLHADCWIILLAAAPSVTMISDRPAPAQLAPLAPLAPLPPSPWSGGGLLTVPSAFVGHRNYRGANTPVFRCARLLTCSRRVEPATGE